MLQMSRTLSCTSVLCALLLVSCATPPSDCDPATSEQCHGEVESQVQAAPSPGIFLQQKIGQWSKTASLSVGEDGKASLVKQLSIGKFPVKLAYDGKMWTLAAQTQSSVKEAQYMLVPVMKESQIQALEISRAGEYRFDFDFKQNKTMTMRFTSSVHDYHKSFQNVDFSDKDQWRSVTFSQNNTDYKIRRYAQTSSLSGQRGIQYSEKEKLPRLRSGQVSFDALFALSFHQILKYQVEKIGKTDCHCFVTNVKPWSSELWDFALAVDLSLALVDSQRSQNTLTYFYENQKMPDNYSQEYDFLLWLLAVEEQLKYLSLPRKKEFAKQWYPSLRAFVEYARDESFVGKRGLYFAQQYQLLSVKDAAGKLTGEQGVALMNHNMLHFYALRFISNFAQLAGDEVMSVKYADWASDLRFTINNTFWSESKRNFLASETPEVSMGNTFVQTESLLSFMASSEKLIEVERTKQVLGSLPITSQGIPLVYPPSNNQQWKPYSKVTAPFVNVYALRSASYGKNLEKAESLYQHLVYAAAFNLQHSKYLDIDSQKALTRAPFNPSGLLASAAYIDMVVSNIFGMQLSQSGMYFTPVLSRKVHEQVFNAEKTMQLLNLQLHGKSVNIVLRLPALQAQAEDAEYLYPVLSVKHNGQPIMGEISWGALTENNTIEVSLGRKSDVLK